MKLEVVVNCTVDLLHALPLKLSRQGNNDRLPVAVTNLLNILVKVFSNHVVSQGAITFNRMNEQDT